MNHASLGENYQFLSKDENAYWLLCRDTLSNQVFQSLRQKYLFAVTASRKYMVAELRNVASIIQEPTLAVGGVTCDSCGLRWDAIRTVWQLRHIVPPSMIS